MTLFEIFLLKSVATPAGAYLIGSIPSGLLVARAMGLGDPRSIGSGNIGATNVLRTGNRVAAGLTLAFDAGKGALAVILAYRLVGENANHMAALFVVVGHMFPVWLRFRGGKGVATFLGVMLALGFWAGFAACMTWLLVAGLFRYSSLASLAAAASTPVWLAVTSDSDAVLIAAALAVLVWVRHLENIRRLVARTEPRIGAKRQLADGREDSASTH